MLLKLIIITTLRIYSCIDLEKNENHNIGCISIMTDQKDISESTLLSCSKMASEDKWIGYLCLCRINWLKNNFNTAQAACFKAKEKNPFNPYVYTEIARLYRKQGKIDSAITEVEFALNLSTDNFDANLLAAELIENTKPQKALEFYKKALLIAKQSNKFELIGKKTFIETKIKELSDIVHKKNIEKENLIYESCLKNYKSETDNLKALEKIEKCIKMRKTHSPQITLDYIKLLYLNSNYDLTLQQSKKIDPKNLLESQRKDLYLILADSYYQKKDIKNSLKIYKQLFDMGIEEYFVLIKYAQILESDGDKITALEVYKKIYSLKQDPLIHEKIELLKIEVMDKDEILKEMKIRGFIEKEKVVLLPENKKLFYTLKLLERKGAISWLEKNYPGYANLILISENGEKKLMNSGYNLYLRYLSQQFIKHLQTKNVIPNYLFRLVDENGTPIFDTKGNLTYEGLLSYFKAQDTNSKTWFYPTEIQRKKIELKTSYEDKEKRKKAEIEAKKLINSGYEEISEPEYLWLLRATNCPEDILLNPPCNLRKIDYGDTIKYFICSKNEVLCGATSLTLYTYINSYRSGNTDIIDTSKSTAFFGTGAVKKHRFCEDGKIWTGN
ncbi:MAG: hypothetical protein K6357_08230 [Elusimicrobiota bacterium]